jgi:hypothetical protein
MLKRHSESSEGIPAQIIDLGLKIPPLPHLEQAAKIKKQMKDLEKDLGRLLGVPCKLQVITEP